MENWQRHVINKNLPQLIEDTICHPTLLARLLAADIISKEEKSQVDVTLNPTHKADYLYKILGSRPNSYHLLLQACRETKQSGVVYILEQGELEHKLYQEQEGLKKGTSEVNLEIEVSQNNEDDWQDEFANALEKCHVSEFAPKNTNFIFDGSFENFEKAISEYMEVDKFKTAFQEYQIDFPSSIWGPQNETLLHVASAYGHISLIEYLIERGISVTEEDSKRRTPAHYVGKFSTNIIETTRVLVQHKSNLGLVDEEDANMAVSLVKHGIINGFQYHHWLEYIIGNGFANLLATQPAGSGTLLHNVVQILDLERKTIELILKWQNVSLDSVDCEIQTALHIALLHGRSLGTIKSLIDLGANIESEVYLYGGVLHFAVQGGNKDVFLLLLSLKADINQKAGNNSETPLHKVRLMKNRNHFDMTKFLLDNGANLYSKAYNGYTVAHLFSLEKVMSDEEFKVWVTAMLKNGFGKVVGICDSRKKSILHTSMEIRDLDKETIHLIIKMAKIDINQADNEGNTILHLAVYFRRSLDTIKNLIELGADWKLRGRQGVCILSSAVMGSNHEAFIYFSSLGADVDAADEYGQTPLHNVRWAREKDYLGMTKLVLEHRADYNIRDRHGKSLDQLMSAAIRSEDYLVWKQGMILLGHADLFEKPCI